MQRIAETSLGVKFIKQKAGAALAVKTTTSYYMANPVLGKSLCSDWFFLGQDFAVRDPTRVFLFWSEAGKFKICNQNTEKKNCEYCHSSQ